MKLVMTILFTFYANIGLSCLVDLTDQAAAAARQAVFDNANAPGLRVGWNGMKELNKRFGLGGVNSVVASYESRLCNQFSSAEFRQANPGVEVRIQKTDFKGYYIECTPTSSCRGVIEEQISRVPRPRFEDGTVFENSVVRAQNYQEGYIRSRMLGTYSEEAARTPNIASFINDEMSAAVQEATGNNSISAVDASDEEFMARLARNVDSFRNEGIDSVDQNFRRLVLGLDTLLEIPFTNSSNIENDLEQALRSGDSVPPFQISTAQSGDDMFVVVRRGDEIERIVGADAKGLGVENMTSRYVEFLNQSQSGQITSMSDISELSMRAIDRADLRMEQSFNRYSEILRSELRAGGGNIDEALLRVHNRYASEVAENSQLMTIRAGGISGSSADNEVIMNRITTIHNNLKTMEAAGISNHYGTSCLSTEYWLLRMGLQAK
jgi:hypothetical protein